MTPMTPTTPITPPHNPPSAPTGPEPSVDTTKRQAPGRATKGPVKTAEGVPVPTKEEHPKLPHERDESVDMTHGESDPQIEQAYRDIKRGLQDTDQALRADHVERHQKP